MIDFVGQDNNFPAIDVIFTSAKIFLVTLYKIL